jgi:unsaturated rhamnogalacturonyl hydrolase
VHTDGKLGWVQQIGAAPASVTFEDNQEYGSGAFLLAGSEMYKLKK